MDTNGYRAGMFHDITNGYIDGLKPSRSANLAPVNITGFGLDYKGEYVEFNSTDLSQCSNETKKRWFNINVNTNFDED